jgi:hypothetical protein
MFDTAVLYVQWSIQFYFTLNFLLAFNRHFLCMPRLNMTRLASCEVTSAESYISAVAVIPRHSRNASVE